jgi:hypothetical protein
MPISAARSLVPDQQGVDAGDSGDRLGIGDRGRRLHQGDDEQCRVGGLDHFADWDPFEIEDRLRAGERAVANRRVFQVIDDLAHLLRRIDMRHDNPKGARVEHAGRHRVLHERHADDRRDAGVEGRYRECGGEFNRHRAVFKVDEQPVIARCFHHLGDIDGSRCADAHTQRHLAVFEPLPRRVANLHPAHPISLSWVGST